MADKNNKGITAKKYLKKWTSITVILLLVAVNIAFSGCSIIPKEQQVDAPPLAAPSDIKYNTVEVKRGSIAVNVSGRGTFDSIKQQSVYFTYGKGGNLKNFYVEAGDTVKKGQLLAELDANDINNQMAEQQLMLEKSQLTYDELKAEGANEYKLKSANIDIQLNEIKVKELQDELKKAKLYAPISGIVVYFAEKKLGEFIDSYTPLYIIADPNDVDIKVAAVYGGSQADFAINTNVTITYKQKQYSGKVVTSASSSPNAASNNPVRIKIDKLASGAKLGDVVDFTAQVMKRDNVLLVPASALHQYDNYASVFVLENGQKIEKYVKAGLKNNDMAEIVEGLKEGDKIIID